MRCRQIFISWGMAWRAAANGIACGETVRHDSFVAFIDVADLLARSGRSLYVYCDDWPGFCQPDGRGVYLDIVRAIYQPNGYQVMPRIVPYKRALAVIAQKGATWRWGSIGMR